MLPKVTIIVLLYTHFTNKDGVFLTRGVVPKAKSPNPKLTPLRVVSDEDLFDYCVENKVGYGYYCEEKRRRTVVDTTVTDDTSYGDIVEWLNLIELPTDLYSTVLIGQTGIGKTSWAIKNCPKPAIVCSHIEDLKKFEPNRHKSIIFDDMSFTHLPLQAQIHLVDSDLPRSIHVRWGVALLPAKVTKIFTCNDMPFTEHPAIIRRIKFIKD